MSEACTEAILGAGGEDAVDLRLEVEDGSLRVRVRGPGSGPPEREDGVDLLPALFQDVRATDEADGHRSVSFSVPIA